jgi:hypothetical protein
LAERSCIRECVYPALIWMLSQNPLAQDPGDTQGGASVSVLALVIAGGLLLLTCIRWCQPKALPECPGEMRLTGKTAAISHIRNPLTPMWIG